MPTRLTRLRYLGLAGSAVLATGAYQVGARPGLADQDGLPASSDIPALLACLAGLITLTVAWWRAGTLAAVPAANAPSGRWMLVSAALWAAPLLVAPPLASRDIYAYACQGALIEAGLDPHTSGPGALPCPWLDSVPAVWREAASPYGPLFGLLSAAAAAVSGGDIVVAVALLRLVAVAGIVLATWYGRILARACRVPESGAAWLGLASPLVLVHAVSGGHSDALLAGLVLAALGLAAPREPARLRRNTTAVRGIAAGAALGLAVAVKGTALAALPFVVLLLVPAPRALRRLGTVSALVAAATALAYTVVAAASGLGLGFVHGLTRAGDLVQWTSVPTAVGMTAGYLLRLVGADGGYDASVAVARVVGLGVAAGITVAAWWRAWRAPANPVRAAVLACGVAMAALALLGPVFYPWYALTPLALLAVAVADARTRTWAGVASGALSFLILPNGTGLAPRTKAPGALAVTAAAAVAVRRMRALPRRSRTPGS
jgi:4-amino-4-deoxy-L-arabinose transferase-like glycosyltransferase